MSDHDDLADLFAGADDGDVDPLQEDTQPPMSRDGWFNADAAPGSQSKNDNEVSISEEEVEPDDVAEMVETPDDTGKPARPVVLPEPTIIAVPKKRVQHDIQPQLLSDDVVQAKMDKMRASVRAAGASSVDSVRTQDEQSGWVQTLDYYMKVLQSKQREKEQGGERVRFVLTTDKVQERRDRLTISNMLRKAYVERDAGGGDEKFMEIVDYVYNEVVGLSVLAPLWNDTDITEIMVDGYNKIYYERGGVLHQTDLTFRDVEHLEVVARNMAESISDRSLTKSNPLVTARLPGARVAFAFGDIAGEDKVYIAIRKHHGVMGVAELLANGTLDEEMFAFLRDCVHARINILISGGTGAGKTTIINAVSSFIPNDERVITIEDSYELELRNHYWTRLQSKEKASADDLVVVSISDLLKHTLRMRPDRIVVGEVRDGHAAAALLEAANTGHDGTLTTLHANGAWDAVNERLPGLYRQDTNAPVDVAKSAVARAFSLVIHVTRRHGRRFVSEIAEVGKIDRMTDEIGLRILWKTQLRGEELVTQKLAYPMMEGELAHKFSEAGIPLQTGNLRPDEPARTSSVAIQDHGVTPALTPSENQYVVADDLAGRPVTKVSEIEEEPTPRPTPEQVGRWEDAVVQANVDAVPDSQATDDTNTESVATGPTDTYSGVENSRTGKDGDN